MAGWEGESQGMKRREIGKKAKETLTALATPTLPNSTSISSNVILFVSGTTNQINTAPPNVNTPKKINVP